MSADPPSPSGFAARPWWLIAVGVAASVGVGAWVLPGLRLDPAADPTAPSAAMQASLPRGTTDRPDTAQDGAGTGATGPQPGDSESAAAANLGEPAFDLVRREADGTTLVAGKARPRAEVSLVIDGVTRARTTSDAQGQFVVFVALESSSDARVMWLLASERDGEVLASVDTVILAPDGVAPPAPEGPVGGFAVPGPVGPDGAPSAVALLAPRAAPPARVPNDLRYSAQPGSAVAGSGAAPSLPARRSAQDAAPEADSTPAGTGVAATSADQRQSGGNDRLAPPAEPAATDLAAPAGGAAPEGLAATPTAPGRALLNDTGGVRLLDTPPLSGGAQVRLDSLDYGPNGGVVLRGRAAPGGTVTALLDGRVQAQVNPDAGGAFTLTLDGVAPGDYALNLTRRDAAGAVSGSVAVPFRREPPSVVANALTDAPARMVTVQPGATLWAIARDRYGDGTRYVQVYDANRDAIRDPDLIYPGQVFELPESPRP
ncbi:LysM peptidoglycan-binding domain-containing protein [Meridianimarinicoccus roseus]|uniref:LysM peptidoglycan-binding domain-containing protein n=1 Tax=Meridianimarinicoccus roseus TaxID=2072018 RepID=UPI001EE6536B|nr:LysM peptidoglycan-binding domain-containing protein [Meridianimarinicoccus roseus]